MLARDAVAPPLTVPYLIMLCYSFKQSHMTLMYLLTTNYAPVTILPEGSLKVLYLEIERKK